MLAVPGFQRKRMIRCRRTGVAQKPYNTLVELHPTCASQLPVPVGANCKPIASASHLTPPPRPPQVANRDVAALERGLAAVLQGDVAFDDPLHLSPHNYAQLIRLCQLGIDYLEHEVAWRRNIVLSLQEKYAGMRRYGGRFGVPGRWAGRGVPLPACLGLLGRF